MSAESELKSLIQKGVDSEVKTVQEMQAIVDNYVTTTTWSMFIDEYGRLGRNDKAALVDKMFKEAVEKQGKGKKLKKEK